MCPISQMKPHYFSILSLLISIIVVAAFLPGSGAPLQERERHAQPETAPDPKAPRIAFVPPEMHVTESADHFVDEEVKILNAGGAPLVIRNIKASCYCGSAVVLKGRVHPMDTGKIRVRVNSASFKDSVSLVTYSIYTNTPDSVVTYKVYVRKHAHH